MGALRALSIIVAVVFISGVWCLPSYEGDNARAERAAPTVKVAIANTKADADSKAKDGMASSSSSAEDNSTFVSKHHHDKHARDLKIAVAETDAVSDSKAKDGMAASSSSTKGNAAFLFNGHHEEKEVPHEKPEEAQIEKKEPVETMVPEDKQKEKTGEEKKEIPPRQILIDFKPIKEKIKKIVKESLDV